MERHIKSAFDWGPKATPASRMAPIETLLVSLFAWIIMGLSPAIACTCGSSPPANARGAEEVSAWRLEQAANVVRGRIVDIRAGEDTLRRGYRIVVAKMKVDAVVKGDVPARDLTILTTFGVGDCGVASFLLAGIAWDRDVTLEIRTSPEFLNEYLVDMCGYGTMAQMPSPTQPPR